jgi:glycosyltransferase involved in cell wall biosynthesis/CxxC motif-containing protein
LINEDKICFICSYNDEVVLEESVKYIKALSTPRGIEIEIKFVNKNNSVTKAYNEIMNESDARYKVYLNESVFIINRNFIFDILKIFSENSKVGVLGLVGSKKASPEGGMLSYGKVYQTLNSLELTEFNAVSSSYQIVEFLEDILLVTDHDLSWREEVNNLEYVQAQCLQFIESGFQVGVVNQETPWVIFDNNLHVNETELQVKHKNEVELQQIFANENEKEKLPLVSVLIPTYNRPVLFEVALKSALEQSYANIEVVIGDDSTNNETEQLIKKYLKKYSNIRYIKNERNLGQFDNDLMLFSEAKGEYINFLMDDDFFHPEKIERMMYYYINDKSEEIKLVTSHRKMFDNDYRLFEDDGISKKLYDEDKILDGVELGDFVLKHNFNCIGEPTTVLFRKSDLKVPFGTFCGRRYDCNVDMATWLNLLSQGKAVYISDTLSYFRIHEGQQLNTMNMRIKGLLDYSHSLLVARSKGFLTDINDYSNGLSYCQKMLCEHIDELKTTEKNNEINLLVNKLQLVENELEELESGNINANSKKFPLVSILIPTYNQTIYLKDALESAINQTYPNIEIIIGDDSSNDEVEVFVKSYLDKYDNITYIRNVREVMDYGVSNINNLLSKSNGDYINYLNHDDVFHESKITKMMQYFISLNNIAFVTSHRQLIDDNGSFLPDSFATKRLFLEDTIVDEESLGLFCLENITNFIGEPTSVLFKKSQMVKGLGYFNDRRYFNLTDFATWLSLLQCGKAVYISETLSYFRQHSEQNSSNKSVYLSGIVEWKQIIDESYKQRLITDNTKYTNLISKWFYTFNNVFKTLSFSADDLPIKNQLLQCFTDALTTITETKNYNHICILCDKKVEHFNPYIIKTSEYIKKYDIIGSDLGNHSCPHCNCHDRERHLTLYFSKLKYWEKIKSRKILHVAPEYYLSQVIRNLNPKEYICADLFPTRSDVIKMDIKNIAYDNNYFDFIICNHVLEHILDDIKAMKELYRVLKVGGQAVLQTPYSPLIEKSYEDETIDNPQSRLEYFGQEDHVRVYGLDFFKRLEMVGFKLSIVESSKLFTLEESNYFGVNHKEDLILVTK